MGQIKRKKEGEINFEFGQNPFGKYTNQLEKQANSLWKIGKFNLKVVKIIDNCQNQLETGQNNLGNWAK